MPSRRRASSAASTATKLAELAFAVPQVVGHRVTRMALAGPRPSARDREEFTRMVAEKQLAFSDAYQAMFWQSLRANQALTASLCRSFWAPVAWGRVQPLKATTAGKAAKASLQVQRAALGVLGKGLDPVHKTAVANAKRLAKTKLR